MFMTAREHSILVIVRLVYKKMYSPVDRRELRSNDHGAARAATIVNSFDILIAWVIIALLIALLLHSDPAPVITNVPSPAPDPNVNVTCLPLLTANSTACNQTTECTQGFLGPDSLSCTYYDRPTTVTGCTNACFPIGDTHCEAGRCVGDPAECVGYCSSLGHCNVLLPYNDATIFFFDPATNWVITGWYTPYGCILGTCIFSTLDIFAGSNTEAIYTDPSNVTYHFTPLGAKFTCADYYQASFLAQYGDCVHLERYLLASAVVDYAWYNDGDYGNSSFPFQVSICILTFSCGFSTPPVPAPPVKRSLSDDSTPPPPPMKTPEQWGFHTTGTTETPKGPLMGISDPFRRNAHWAQLSAMVANGLPGFLTGFISQFNGSSPTPVPVPV